MLIIEFRLFMKVFQILAPTIALMMSGGNPIAASSCVSCSGVAVCRLDVGAAGAWSRPAGVPAGALGVNGLVYIRRAAFSMSEAAMI